jgi:uncharacterized repeat protein (TIGR04138 family)
LDPKKIYDLVRTDPRYAFEAYEFVCEAVSYTQERLGRAPEEDDDPDADHHVSGGELLRGACELAVEEFGMMAPLVFRAWGVRKTDDFGHIVFNLIQGGCLSKSDRDDPDDFRDVFDLDKVLTEGFEITAADLRPGKGGR